MACDEKRSGVHVRARNGGLVKRMRLLGTVGALLALSVAFLSLGTALGAGKPTGALYAVSDGKGEIRLLWFPVPDAWRPGGWRLEDAGSGAVLVPHLAPGEPAAVAKLSEEDRRGLRNFTDFLADDTKGREMGFVVFVLKALTNWDFARAVGVGAVLEQVPAGPRSYRVVGLDAAGKQTGYTLLSPALDAAVATPAPPPPADLRAGAAGEGISLSWSSPDRKGLLPVIGYLVFRDGAGETNKLLTRQPFIPGMTGGAVAEPSFLDPDAPRDEPLLYRVQALDPFGRRSEAAVVQLVAADLRGMLAPLLRAAVKNDRVDLSWDPGKKIKRAGFFVERGYRRDGPFEPLTETMLPPAADSWRDAGLKAGTFYFYRLRAVGTDGAVGDPSPPVRVRAMSEDPPPPPENLKADVGRTRVRLTWKAPEARVSGYFVERWAKGVGKWTLLTPRSVPETRHDDDFALQASGTYRYRVRALGYDNQESRNSREVEAVLPDMLGPRPPQITGIDGKDGAVLLRFRPAPPEGDVERYLVLRSDVEGQDGQVIGDPLPAKSREYRDARVVAGKRYWYRFVALDAKRNRGDLSLPASVVVEPGEIPVPKKPAAAYRTDVVPRVEIAFIAPPPGLAAVVERRQNNGAWLVVSGPAAGLDKSVDLGFASGVALQYRVVYQAASGRRGQPSPPVDVKLP